MSTRREFFLLSSAFAINSSLPMLAFAEPSPFPLFDAHLHFFTDDIAHYSMDLGIAKQRERLLASPNTVEKVLVVMNEMNVQACAGVQYRTAYGTDDSYLLDVAKAHPDRIVPIVILDATKPGAAADYERLVKSGGAAGLRLTGPEEKDGSDPWLNSPPALDVWTDAAALKTPVTVMYMPAVMGDASEDSLKRILDLAVAYPNLKIVLDHVGWPLVKTPGYGLTGMHAKLKQQKNVYYKMTTLTLELLEKSEVPAPDFVRALVDFYGADHVMWGSDFGNSTGTYKDLVERGIRATGKLTLQEKRHVLHDTGHSVYRRA